MTQFPFRRSNPTLACHPLRPTTLLRAKTLLRTIVAGALSLTMLSLGGAHAQTGTRKATRGVPAAPHGYDYERPEGQPATENLDLDMYTRIRVEGIEHSHVMQYASALFDGIGPRLTGSPNMAKANAWTRDQLTAMGCSNARLESWGDFGLGWRQIATSVSLATPDTATFIAQATPWSPPTQGEVTANVIAVPRLREEKQFDEWKGKLAGKIILYGKVPDSDVSPAPLFHTYDDKDLEGILSFPLDGNFQEQHITSTTPKFWADVFRQINFQEEVAKFFADQRALAILAPSYAGEAGIIKDDNNEAMGTRVFLPDHKQPIPSAVIANEAFGRMSRLLNAGVSVAATVNINTQFTGEKEQGYNTIAEIPGTDPQLKDQIVMAGGHLDSWIAGTGATDDGAGAIIAMEAMRILTALHVQPRRTIRIALWSGEEQGEMGSLEYVRQHFGAVAASTTAEQVAVPLFLRERVGPVSVKPEQALVSAYFNLDNGGGRLRGIYAERNAAIVPIFEQWIAPLMDLGVTTVSMRPSGSTDHEPFTEVGIPGFQFIQDPRDYSTRTAHTNQDTYERLSSDDLKQAATVEAIFLYNAAMRDQMLPRKPLPDPARDKGKDER
jgi:carboxypeptidase Q